MKKHWVRLLVATAGIGVLYACATSGASRADGTIADAASAQGQKQRLSYGVGFYLGEEVRSGMELDGLEPDLELLKRGFRDAINRDAPMLDREELDDVLFAVHRELQRRQVERQLAENSAFRKLHDDNLATSKAFHARHANEPGVVTLDNGLQYQPLRSGDGPSPGLEDVVVLTFEGRRLDGYHSRYAATGGGSYSRFRYGNAPVFSSTPNLRPR